MTMTGIPRTYSAEARFFDACIAQSFRLVLGWTQDAPGARPSVLDIRIYTPDTPYNWNIYLPWEVNVNVYRIYSIYIHALSGIYLRSPRSRKTSRRAICSEGLGHWSLVTNVTKVRPTKQRAFKVFAKKRLKVSNVVVMWLCCCYAVVIG